MGPPSPDPAADFLPDVVYRVKKLGWQEQLRYSLRSLRNLPHGKVWIAGYKPGWTSGAVNSIATIQAGNKWENSNENLRAACNEPGVSDTFYLFDDDFYVHRPTDTVPVYHRGTITEMLDWYKSQLTNDSNYLKRVREARGVLKAWGFEEPLSYEVHVPLPVHKYQMAGVLNRLKDTELRFPGAQYRSFYGNLCNLDGSQIVDPKVSYPQNHVAVLPEGVSEEDITFVVGEREETIVLDTPFVSTNRATFTTATGEWIKALFPEPCEYEE